MQIFVLLLTAILVYIMFTVIDTNTFIEERSRNVPREHPVYIDEQTVYLNQPILYSEWEREISSQE